MTGPDRSRSAAADGGDRYASMLALADLFDASGEEVRARAGLGEEVLQDPAVAGSAELSPPTFAEAEAAVRAATSGEHGLLARGIELDADALMVRATVLTYRWIDELQEAVHRTLGSIAARAIGYLAPEVALGGSVVAAGLIETEALDRDGIAAYLNELAVRHPELMDHVTSGGGGLLDGLQLRSWLTAAALTADDGRLAAAGGLRALGAVPLTTDFGAALRDVAGGFVQPDPALPPPVVVPSTAPRDLEDLMTALTRSPSSIHVQHIGDRRYIVYLSGPGGATGGRPRLVGGDHTAYAGRVVRAIEKAVAGHQGARVMLVGSAQGGVTAAEIAASVASPAFVIEQVVTAGAPSAQVPRIPDSTHMLSLEERSDPVALLGSLVNAGAANRVTVIFDGSEAGAEGVYVAGGRAADAAEHPELRRELQRLRASGFLAG